MAAQGGVYRAPVPVIERLRLDHAAAVLVFEPENRAYFAASVSDRGDDYFTGFQTQEPRTTDPGRDNRAHRHARIPEPAPPPTSRTRRSLNRLLAESDQTMIPRSRSQR
jgi:hypothetical protein